MQCITFLVILVLSTSVSAQTTIQTDMGPCGLHGKAKKNTKEYDPNALKNRYNLPGTDDMDTSQISLDHLMTNADPNAFPTDKAISITGYVFNVKVGGIESCNCKAKKAQYRDTHIELTPDADHTDSNFRVIVEVTPRLRNLMLKKGINWSTTTLKKKLIGHTIEVTGWLFYDAEHEDQASANDPNDEIGRKNFRATCWEIHPITSLSIKD
jgi:hypothetical protein